MVEMARLGLSHYAPHAKRGTGPDYHHCHVCSALNIPMIVVDLPQIPEYSYIPHHDHDRLSFCVDLHRLAGVDATGQIHEDHVLRSALHLCFGITMLPCDILCRQCPRAQYPKT